MNIAQIFELNGQEDSARLYYDSCRVELLESLGQTLSDFHIYSTLGLTYAFLGMADSAIANGMKGKEVMSVDDCHW
jgi:hypothetical protein